MVYEIQVNGSANANSIGQEYNFDTTTGSAVTDGYIIGTGGAGFSTTALAATPVGSGNVGQVRVVGLGRETCLLYTSPSPRDGLLSRMPSSA